MVRLSLAFLAPLAASAVSALTVTEGTIPIAELPAHVKVSRDMRGSVLDKRQGGAISCHAMVAANDAPMAALFTWMQTQAGKSSRVEPGHCYAWAADYAAIYHCNEAGWAINTPVSQLITIADNIKNVCACPGGSQGAQYFGGNDPISVWLGWHPLTGSGNDNWPTNYPYPGGWCK